jgi:hypothetical protein
MGRILFHLQRSHYHTFLSREQNLTKLYKKIKKRRPPAGKTKIHHTFIAIRPPLLLTSEIMLSKKSGARFGPQILTRDESQTLNLR